VLDFWGLTDRFLERDLEDAILREIEIFLLELGAGFSCPVAPASIRRHPVPFQPSLDGCGFVNPRDAEDL
jgi:hypothetical protein